MSKKATTKEKGKATFTQYVKKGGVQAPNLIEESPNQNKASTSSSGVPNEQSKDNAPLPPSPPNNY